MEELIRLMNEYGATGFSAIILGFLVYIISHSEFYIKYPRK